MTKEIAVSPLQNAKLAPVSLKIVESATFDQWIEIGDYLKRIAKGMQFWVGDWLNFGERKYGEMYSQALEMFDYEYGTLTNVKFVATAIESSRRRDNLSYSIHQAVAGLEPKDQDKLLDLAEKNGLSVLEVRNKVRALKYAQLDTPKTPKGKYGTIVIDPPWPMEIMKMINRPNQTEMPYPTMSVEEIRDFDVVAKIADENCNLFLWTTHAFLPDALQIIESWGFKYHVTLTWDKTNGRSLFGFNRRTEFVIYAYKGKITVNQRGKFIDTVFVEKLREHSRKPEIFYDMIREHTSGPRIDIFSREKRKGFDQYGNEENKFNE